MAGFEAIYKQTVTIWNRVHYSYGEEMLWYPTVIENVHLIIDKSNGWDSNGGHAQDNARLHIRYQLSGGKILVAGKQWLEPKVYRKQDRPQDFITFAYGDGDTFDFFMEGTADGFDNPVSDDMYSKKGFYNYMNSNYDNVFAITSVSKYNLIPHFEIMAR